MKKEEKEWAGRGTVSIRRNPPRRGRPTPSSADISAFPLADILSIESTSTCTNSNSNSNSDSNLKVFLRVRGIPINKKSCIIVNDDLHSVTVTPPSCGSGRSKSEMYTGFSHVFSPVSSQDEVYDTMMRPLVEDFLVNGTTSLLAALGPTGSGKTHTVFGSPQHPGLLPRTLDHIWNSSVSCSRSFYMSIFEIFIEKGKSEKLCDLSPDGGHIFMQQSLVKGLKQVLVKDLEQAQAIVAAAHLKRATAFTNSNTHSSRSQCIINIRYTLENENENAPQLTFVDLAGAERDRNTANQGGRLLQTNFINNTSMVFGLCLRETLTSTTLPNHQYLIFSLFTQQLTRYLRDYLQGRKRMALILTARSAPEHYFDASFLLRQASPFMEIKFQNMEETSKLPGNKRRKQMTCSDNQKRAKLGIADEKDGVEATTGDLSKFCNEDNSNKINDDSLLEASETTLAEVNNPNAKLQRDYYVMQGFAKALWNVMKQYKEKVKVMQKEIDLLTENISTGHVQYLEMEKELQHLKSRCFCPRELPDHQPVGIIAPEEQPKASPSECKSPSFSQVKDDHNHLVGEIVERSFSEAGCKLDNNEIITSPGHEHSEGKSEFSALQTLKNGSREIQDLGATVVCEVPPRNYPSSTRSLEFVNEKTEHDAILGTQFEGGALPSNDVESSVQQDYQGHSSAIQCEISRDCVGMVDKDSVEKTDTILKDAVAAHFPKSHVVDLKAHNENIGDSVDEKMEKENVTNTLQSNFNSKLEAKEISHKSLKSERPKRRLMPASSLLLRDSSSLDISDDNVKHRGGRGGQRLFDDECKRTKGSASLLRLLKNHLPR
ncbi:hypothetical protein KSS87_008134 [Heliosperma pusillum]|nr:hypothetical protein KSS87_008134 [Heliosperma pusillum]